MKHLRQSVIIGLVALAFVVSACGETDDNPGSAGDGTTAVDSGDASSGSDGEDDGASVDPVDDGVPADRGTLPDGFPEELTPPDGAVYDDLIDSLSSSEQDGKRVFFVKAHIPGSVSEVVDAIRSQLESAGVEITLDEDTGAGDQLEAHSFNVESDSYTASINVDDLDTTASIEGSANANYEVREK